MSSRWNLWVVSIIITLLGVADSTYLTVIKLTHNEASCIKGVGDCFSVNTSRYSELWGIPIAVFGLAAYLAILVLLFLERRGGFWRTNSPIGVFGISLFGTLYSAYLTYLEIAVIKAICPYCVISAVCMLVLFVLSLIRLASSPSQT